MLADQGAWLRKAVDIAIWVLLSLLLRPQGVPSFAAFRGGPGLPGPALAADHLGAFEQAVAQNLAQLAVLLLAPGASLVLGILRVGHSVIHLPDLQGSHETGQGSV